MSRPLLALAAAVLGCLLAAAPARAQICTDCICETTENQITQQFIADEENTSRAQIEAEVTATQNFLVNTVFQQDFLPWWMNWAQTITTIGMDQVFIFGTFLDAKEQLETQRLFQQLAARAHKDYQPSDGICTFGTVTRSLAASERLGEFNAHELNEWGERRNTGSMDVAATDGEESDRPSRLAMLRDNYCDLHDENNGLDMLCTIQADAQTVNKDVDYAGIMEHGLTLNVDFVDPMPGDEPTDDEKAIVGLGNNLYANQALLRIPETVFHIDENKPKILDVRSLMAERSVAEAPFFSIAGMKSEGTPLPADNIDPPPDPPGGGPIGSSVDTGQYMHVILKQLIYAPDGNEGVDQIIDQMLGAYNADTVRPSYYAQMEVLTKKLYENPGFYTELYDTPANVLRKKVALQAIGLMQDFDTLQSYLRTEMMLSQMLELEIVKLQGNVQNQIDRLREEGPKGTLR